MTFARHGESVRWAGNPHQMFAHAGSSDPDAFNVSISFPEALEVSNFRIPTYGASTSLTLYPSGTTFDGNSGECAKVCRYDQQVSEWVCSRALTH
jgi:hypothetical protein